MWILDRLEIALQRADLMFGSIAEDGSLGYGRTTTLPGHRTEFSTTLYSVDESPRTKDFRWSIFLKRVGFIIF